MTVIFSRATLLLDCYKKSVTIRGNLVVFLALFFRKIDKKSQNVTVTTVLVGDI